MPENTIIPIRYPWAMSYCCMTLLKGEKNILIDTGFEKSVSPFLEEALKKEELALKDIDLIFNTHSHSDHVEGNRKIASASKAQVYIHPSGEASPYIKELPVPVKYFSDGEKIENCRIIFTPGHSPDSVCILEEKSSTCIIGDSIEGRGSAFAGVALIHNVPDYLASIKNIRQLYNENRIERMIFSHFTDGFGDEVTGKDVEIFLEASEETVYLYRQTIEALLQKDPFVTAETAGEVLRKKFAVSQNLISPGTANGVAHAFLLWCREMKQDC